LESPKHVENSKGSLFNVCFPTYRGPDIFQFDWRGVTVGETVGRIDVVRCVWYQQGGLDLVDHVPGYRMVGFGRNGMQSEGAGGHTKKTQPLANLL
jgi:hypothetical protein